MRESDGRKRVREREFCLFFCGHLCIDFFFEKKRVDIN